MGQARSLRIVSTCSLVQPIGAAEHLVLRWSVMTAFARLRGAPRTRTASCDVSPLRLSTIALCFWTMPLLRREMDGFTLSGFGPSLRASTLWPLKAWNSVEHDSLAASSRAMSNVGAPRRLATSRFSSWSLESSSLDSTPRKTSGLCLSPRCGYDGD